MEEEELVPSEEGEMMHTETRASDEDNMDGEDGDNQDSIIRTAGTYIRNFRLEHCEVRYDTISIVGTPATGAEITHKENAFDLTSRFFYRERIRHRRSKRPGTW